MNGAIIASVLLEQDMTFTTKVSRTSVDVDNQAEYLTYVRSDCDITWSAEFEYRSWGIKSIEPTILKLHVEIEFEDEDDSKPVRTEHVVYDREAPKLEVDPENVSPRNIVSYYSRDIPWNVETKLDGYREMSAAYCPQSVEIDYAKRMITVIF